MKVITIGRKSDNDIVIDDGYVGRHHCQVVEDNYGNYKIVDLNSINGTFVNGKRCQGEVVLHFNDVVRIGNTLLPWQSYFDESSDKTKVYSEGIKSKDKSQGTREDNPNDNSVYPGIHIPSNINIRQDNRNENVNINADVYKSGDDFKVPFKRNVGNHVGNAVGQVGGCLIWVIAIIVIGGIIALCI